MIDPRGYTVTEWTDYMADTLDAYGVLTFRLDDETEWKRWARHVVQSPQISKFNPPDPEAFSDWVEWAIRFNDVVPLVG